ncbi:MAG: sugar kinase [Patescibacteria group bacterium]|nr:sugar kinase [Patescibacteria group bacterium]
MDLLVVGSVAFDDIQTPFGQAKRALGGSASYFSLAASFFARPSLVAVVGDDFTQTNLRVLLAHGVDVSGLQRAKGKTFAWGGKYSFDLNNRQTLFTRLGVFENFSPKLPRTHKSANYLFLGNIHPRLQLDVLHQMTKPKLVGLDTMNFWMDNAPRELKIVLKLVDLFVINDGEARQFTKQHNLVKAARQILGLMGHKKRTQPTLIVKQGEYGLLMFRQNQTFHLPGFPIEDVIDPTGAGDSFAGGLMGYLAKTNDHGWENLKRACVAGSALASFCVEKLGTQRLQQIKPTHIKRRLADFKRLTHFEA